MRRFAATAHVRKLNVPPYLRRVETKPVHWSETALPPAGNARVAARRRLDGHRMQTTG
jgi:hypothetical protein